MVCVLWRDGYGRKGRTSLAQGCFKWTQLFQALQPSEFALGLCQSWRSLGRWAREGFQAHAADVTVFLELVGWQPVGKLEGADLAAARADFALQVSHDPAQVRQREADPQPLIPLPLPVKAQAQALAGQLAVELVGGGNLLGAEGGADIAALRLAWPRWWPAVPARRAPVPRRLARGPA